MVCIEDVCIWILRNYIPKSIVSLNLFHPIMSSNLSHTFTQSMLQKELLTMVFVPCSCSIPLGTPMEIRKKQHIQQMQSVLANAVVPVHVIYIWLSKCTHSFLQQLNVAPLSGNTFALLLTLLSVFLLIFPSAPLFAYYFAIYHPANVAISLIICFAFCYIGLINCRADWKTSLF